MIPPMKLLHATSRRQATYLLTGLLALAGSKPVVAAEGTVCLADGRRLHYTDLGDPGGQLVLFFHGTPGSCRDANVVQENLRQARIRLITPSRPGIGRSTFYGGRCILDWPADVDQLVTAVAGPGARFSILGMSGGTPYSLACARSFPDRIDKVVIASGYAPPGACAPETKVTDALAFLERRPRLARLGIGLMGRRLDTRPEKVLGRVTKAWSETDRQLIACRPELKREVIGTLREATLCGPDGVILDANLLGSGWGFRVCEAAGVPITIVHGQEDEVAPVQMAHWLHQQLPGSELSVFACAGHLSTLIWHIDDILGEFAEVELAPVPALPLREGPTLPAPSLHDANQPPLE